MKVNIQYNYTVHVLSIGSLSYTVCRVWFPLWLGAKKCIRALQKYCIYTASEIKIIFSYKQLSGQRPSLLYSSVPSQQSKNKRYA